MDEQELRALFERLEREGLVEARLELRRSSVSFRNGRLEVHRWLTEEPDEPFPADRATADRIASPAEAATIAPDSGLLPAGETIHGTILLDSRAAASEAESVADAPPQNAPQPHTALTRSQILRDMRQFAEKHPYLGGKHQLDKLSPEPPRPKEAPGRQTEPVQMQWDPKGLEALIAQADACDRHGGKRIWVCTACGSRHCSRCLTPRLGHFNVMRGEYDVKSAACPACGQMCIDPEFELRKQQADAAARAPKREIVRRLSLAGLTLLFLLWTWQGTYLALLTALFTFGPLRRLPRFGRYLTMGFMFFISLLSFVSEAMIWPPATIVRVASTGTLIVFLGLPAVILILSQLVERLVNAVVDWFAR